MLDELSEHVEGSGIVHRKGIGPVGSNRQVLQQAIRFFRKQVTITGAGSGIECIMHSPECLSPL